MDRPRRSTRNSLYNSTPTTTTTPSTSSTSNQNNNNSNPYKKPTYLAGRSSEAGSTPTSRSGRGRGRGRSSAGGRHSNHDNGSTPLSGNGGSKSGKSSRPECVATRVESRRSTGGSSGGGGGGASSNKKKRGAYNSQDYHYGSDFSDQNDSELDEAGSGSESTSELGNDEADSDSDYSIKFSKGTSSSDTAVATTPPSRVPSPPVPLWMEADAVIEELDLPKSSDDLLLARDLVMKAVAIYEPLRRFHQLVRLSPFRFEDFCAALGNEETSPLLTEIHIQLLKTILREEEANATMFGPAEVKDSIQAVLYFIDNLTWPECLRAYIESDPNWGEVLAEMGSGSGGEYPFGGAEIRIKILSWMVDQFLATSLVRDVLVSENIRHDDYCRSCNKMGEVVMCETCPAVYHLYCMTPPYKGDDSIPDDWQCPVCKKNNMSGISDCASELEKAGLLIRHEKLGNDRHGRKYWFLVRRILAESEDGSSVWYYSTPLQVEELLYRLDEEGYEAELVENIRNCKDEIVRQMEVTEQITEQSNSLLHRKTYIEAENAFLKKIHEDRELAHIRELENQAKEAERALEAAKQEEEAAAAEEEEVKQKEELEKKRIREERLLRRNQNKFVDYNPAEWNEDGTPKGGSSGSGDDSSGETGKMNHCNEDKNDLDDTMTKPDLLSASQIANAETQLIDSSEDVTIPKLEPEVQTDEKMDTTENGPDDLFIPKMTDTTTKSVEVKKEEVAAPVSRRKSKALLLDWDTEERMTRLKATGLYKLGQEGNYRNYVNIYNTDNLALSKFQHGEESIKKRHMSHKFSLTAASEVKWNSFSSSVGLRTNMVSTLRATLVHLESAVPITLMHTNWGIMRKSWVSAVAGCTGAKDFAKATITLAACLRSCIYNPVWTESLAHHKLIRTSALEREERKKAEKRDKKDRDDEEDRLRLLPQWVKYSIPAKHQVYKQKGEEYRIHGRWGWIWMSTGRRCKPQDCRKLGLLSGPYKHVIQVKNDSGKVKTILIDPTTFDKLMAKRTLSQKSTPATTPSKVVPPPAQTEAPPPPPLAITAGGEESKEEKVEKMEVDESPVKEEEEVKPEVKEEEKEEATTESQEIKDPQPDKESESTPEEKKCDEVVVASPPPPPQSDDVTPPATETGMEIDPKIEDKPHDQDECGTLIPKDEPVDAPTAAPAETNLSSEMEPLSAVEKVEIKEEKEDEVPPAPRLTSTTPSSPSTSASSDALAASNRKFRTDLINVSLGMVVANRILYPKLAHKSAILDSLLARRISLQKLEEDYLLETYGKEKLEKVQQIVDAGGQIVDEPNKVEEPTVDEKGDEILDDSFPLAGIYRFKCYSHMCQTAAAAFATQTENKVRDYEFKCYSPMCRLKFFVQDSNRRKEERARINEKAKLVALVEEVKGKKMFTQTDSSCKILLKKLPNELNRRRNQITYPTTSKFCSVSTPLDPSIFVLPWHELRKLSRTAGRTFTPSGFAPAPKTGSWAWPYPCGRPLFKTGWQFKAVHSNTLAAAALQLRILWASVKWDDIQMKAPNYDGKNQTTTDMEIITSEILSHRVKGRFSERVQYLRKKTVEPIDAPKTIRAKSRDSSEITPSRSGLRKRKLAESLQGSDPVVTESWVDEDQLELWEIKVYHDKLDRKSDPASSSSKPGTPLGSTRSKSGVSIKQPEKFDPSPSSDGTKGDKTISPAKTAELMREKLETEEKMQRAVHLSKRDNHPKNNNTAVNKQPTPTASQQLQQQQAAAGLPANPRSYGGAAPSSAKKVTIVAPKVLNVSGPGAGDVATTPGAGSTAAAVAILNRSKIAGVVGSTVAIPKVVQQAAQSPTTTVPTPQKITVFRTSDGKLQVRGLLPGQAVYQTADGKIGLTSTPVNKTVQQAGQQTPQQHVISPQPQGQTILIQSQGVGTQLQQVAAAGNQLAIQQSTVSSSQTTPLINISSPTMRTVLSSSPSAVKFISQQQNPSATSTQSPLALTASGQLVQTYSAAGKGNVRKVNPKFPTAIAPTPAPVSSASQQVTGTLNAQGQIVLTRGGQVINQQIVIQPGPAVVVSSSSPNVVGGGNVVAIKSSPISVAQAPATATTPTSASPSQMLVSSSSNSPLPPSQQITTPQGTTALMTYQAGGKIVIQDGNKTIVVTGGANLTTQQLQQILQMQMKKPSGTVMTTQVVPTQPGQQGLKPQQPQQQQQQQQVIVGGGQQQQQQIVQGQGGQQQIQIISGGGAAGTIAGQSLQQIAASGQGQLVLQGVQNLASGHQIATLGGQNVIVKKVMKSPIKSGTPLTIQTVPGQPIPTAAQIQQLLAANKNLIRVDPNTGTVNISSATIQQLQLQQQQQQQNQQSPMLGSTSSVGLGVAGSTTVTKTPGLPISIVSPSKNPKIVPTLFPQGNAAAVKTISSVTTPLVTPSTRYIAPAIVQQQQRLAAPQQMVTSPVLSTNSPPTAVKTTPTTPSSTMQTPPSTPQTPAASQQPKIAAQFIETEEGPRVIVSGFKPGDLTQSQLASLNAQIVKQMQEHPALREKFLGMTDPATELKIILQPHPPNIAGTPQKIVKVPPSLPAKAASGLVKGAGASSPVRGASPVKTSPVKSPVTSASPMKGLPSSPSALIKSPPNSANIEAAIAAVASNADAPVILPAKSSPMKKTQSVMVASSSSPPTSLPTPSKEDMLKNILHKVETENHHDHVISSSPVKPAASPPRRKASPKKPVPPPEVAHIPTEEEQGIPQPIEGDVVIDDGVVNEIEVSENNDAEVPRFVLSQDLMGSGQAGHKQLESSSASSMTFFSSPPHVQEHEIASTTNTPTSPNNKPKSGSSRRKSPVKTKSIMQNSESTMIMSPPKKRINMSPMASPKQINLMHKQTDLLKKDISKKRVLLERDLAMDVREISQDDKGLLSDDVDTNPEQNARPGQGKKRKASGSKSHGGGAKRKKRNSSPGKNSVVKQRPKSGGNKVHCICKTPYDKTRFYICCDICSSWYHGDCIGIPEEEGKNVPEFICVACKPSSSSGSDNKSMCLCRQPYVETQFCIACEKCDEWFHGRCVGILPTEGDSIPAYYCPTCQPGMKINAINAKSLSNEHYVEISKTLRQIQSHKSSYPFMNPVNAADVPNYYKVIKEPMDLKTIALRVEEKMYTKLLDFVADLAKIVDNYRFFNPPESQIYKAGHVLEKFCSQKMGNLRSVLDKQ
ncbi:nucleosome-remodeling factor subunit NURF301 isoform X3 [Folsomia candida]|uniref:nucleosome-remodeling factor subunit NURF301 isoform X3 n=1 Tax=Folsomia candida TaxID=158441 RepID=UPI0016050A7C|nr:nucleosome-remodeling factor subunit NURF301 isoform X3 [Folsomia candida]